jgi:hypothetical protein
MASLRVSGRGRLRLLVGLPLIALAAAACGGGGGGSTAGASSPAHLARCPAKGFVHLRSTGPQAAEELVPSGPTGALVCRYGTKKHGGGLAVTQAKLGAGPRLSRLVDALGSLPEAEGGEVACGSGPLLSYLLVFSYRQEADAYLNVSASPCGTVRNGSDPTLYAATDGLQKLLARIVADAS